MYPEPVQLDVSGSVNKLTNTSCGVKNKPEVKHHLWFIIDLQAGENYTFMARALKVFGRARLSDSEAYVLSSSKESS